MLLAGLVDGEVFVGEAQFGQQSALEAFDELRADLVGFQIGEGFEVELVDFVDGGVALDQHSDDFVKIGAGQQLGVIGGHGAMWIDPFDFSGGVQVGAIIGGVAQAGLLQQVDGVEVFLFGFADAANQHLQDAAGVGDPSGDQAAFRVGQDADDDSFTLVHAGIKDER